MKNRYTMDRICQTCGRTFKARPDRIREGYAKYCSMPCYRASEKGRIIGHQCHMIESATAHFWAHVDSSGGPDMCWPWRGGSRRSGYGALMVDGHQINAHRFSYILANGMIPARLLVCHRCDNPHCVNPAHLFVGTAKDNHHDAMLKGRLPKGDNHPSHKHPEYLARGEANSKAKLTNEKVVSIRVMYETNKWTQMGLSRYWNVCHSTIWAIVHQKTWKHI